MATALVQSLRPARRVPSTREPPSRRPRPRPLWAATKGAAGPPLWGGGRLGQGQRPGPRQGGLGAGGRALTRSAPRRPSRRSGPTRGYPLGGPAPSCRRGLRPARARQARLLARLAKASPRIVPRVRPPPRLEPQTPAPRGGRRLAWEPQSSRGPSGSADQRPCSSLGGPQCRLHQAVRCVLRRAGGAYWVGLRRPASLRPCPHTMNGRRRSYTRARSRRSPRYLAMKWSSGSVAP
jgi:hypothetical protein